MRGRRLAWDVRESLEISDRSGDIRIVWRYLGAEGPNPRAGGWPGGREPRGEDHRSGSVDAFGTGC